MNKEYLSKSRRFSFAIIALLILLGHSTQANQIGLITINGAIGPITASYIQRALGIAVQDTHECLIIQINTPGGLLNSTQRIVESLLSSQLPTVVYVTPSGATAASAGTFITLAAHVAAMTPGTTIGAAHPVAVGGGGANGQQDDVMKEKLENFAATYIEAIAARRKRNVAWAITAVRESAAITAEKAVDLKVIDIVAQDMPDLLKQLDGRKVDGIVLSTASVQIHEIPMLLRERIFQRLWGPELIYILMLVAIFGIIGELSNPGAIFPGVTGAIALILVLFMTAVLPVNITGLALIGLAICLFIADAFTPTNGLLTAGGVVSFFIGSVFLFNTADPAFRLSLAVIIPATVVTAAFFIFIFTAGLRAQHLSAKTGREGMQGKTVTAITPVSAHGGTVFIAGEYWNAVSDEPIDKGDSAEIAEIRGLTLFIKRKAKE